MSDRIIENLQICLENPDHQHTLLDHADQLPQYQTLQTNQLFEHLLQFARANKDRQWYQPLMFLLGSVAAARLQNWLASTDSTSLIELYCITPDDELLRCQLLAMLAAQANTDAWVKLICDSPPTHRDGTSLAFATLVSGTRLSTDQWQQLFDSGTKNKSVAAAIYEFANLQFREKRLDKHPAESKLHELNVLVGHLVSRLEMIEEGQLPDGSTPESVAEIVKESVSLTIAGLDTLSLLGHQAAIPKLYQAMGLKHRRLQVEAAAGLARLDDEQGKKTLVELAQHPVIRPRVIAYAKELGIENEISLEHRGTIAQAESELAIWLAMPQQMGLAPSKMKLIEQRELYWPSYEDPVHCYLFEFEYGSSETAFRNVGISGPLTHAFTANLLHWSVFDQLSAFAGWQTISEEIFQISIDRAEMVLSVQLENLKRRISDQDYADIDLKVLGSFFGEYVLVATATSNNQPGTLFSTDEGCQWVSSSDPRFPIDWELAFDIWKGRRLLTSFNPTMATESQ